MLAPSVARTAAPGRPDHGALAVVQPDGPLAAVAPRAQAAAA